MKKLEIENRKNNEFYLVGRGKLLFDGLVKSSKIEPPDLSSRQLSVFDADGNLTKYGVRPPSRKIHTRLALFEFDGAGKAALALPIHIPLSNGEVYHLLFSGTGRKDADLVEIFQPSTGISVELGRKETGRKFILYWPLLAASSIMLWYSLIEFTLGLYHLRISEFAAYPLLGAVAALALAHFFGGRQKLRLRLHRLRASEAVASL